MAIHKLRILPIFLLITGLTLTSGCKKKDMSLRLNEPRNIRGVVSYKRSFPDLNDKHLEVAKAVGIRPLEDREEAESMKEKLTHITDNEFYVVDSLTHSIPYLVPRASALLDTIGSNFLDSLAAKGLNPNQVIVTSVLRTQSDVKRLRRRNGNASANSAHCFGATFDVSWKRFKKVEDEDGRPLQDVGSDTLKLVLSEVLRDLRQAEKCYIKYELKHSALAIDGCCPKFLFFPMRRRILMQLTYTGEDFEYHFGKPLTLPRCKWKVKETNKRFIWHFKAQNRTSVIRISGSCSKEQMMPLLYENPDGKVSPAPLWEGGTAVGTIELYRRVGGSLELIDRLQFENGLCAYQRF